MFVCCCFFVVVVFCLLVVAIVVLLLMSFFFFFFWGGGGAYENGIMGRCVIRMNLKESKLLGFMTHHEISKPVQKVIICKVKYNVFSYKVGILRVSMKKKQPGILYKCTYAAIVIQNTISNDFYPSSLTELLPIWLVLSVFIF